jgi:hypothetical protein
MTDDTQTVLQTLPLVEVQILRKPFYVSPESSFAFISIEAVSRGMSLDEFEEFIQRYKMKITVRLSREAQEDTEICDGSKVFREYFS